jgi:hypothetical protein
MAGQNAPGQPAESNSLDSTQTGRGTWIQRGRSQQKIGKVIVRQTEDEVRADFLLENGSRRRLEGALNGRDEAGFRVNLKSSGEGLADGMLQVTTGPSQGIGRIYAAGKINGQAFFVHFTERRPLRLNALADGSGSWFQRNVPAPVSALGLTVDGRMRADLVLFLGDGKVRSLSGAAKSKDPVTGTYLIAVKRAGLADTSGQIKVRLTAKNNIVVAEGEATVDGQPGRLQFAARIDAKVRAGILEADAERMRRFEGHRTVGDAATKYTAHIDETGVRYIDAELDQADYGVSHRKMYFEKGRLFYYSEQGQRRSRAANAMNLVELSLSITPDGKLQASSKSVNGKGVKLDAHEASGAIAYADALRKATEEQLSAK